MPHLVLLHLTHIHLFVATLAQFREQILTPLGNPNLALLLLFAGLLLISLEFNRPGTILPGSLGTIAALTALYALDQLPIRPAALLLILTAFTLLLLDLKFPTHGLLTVVGIAALTLGTLTLIDSPNPELRIQPSVALALCISFGLLFAILLRLALRARRQKTLTGLAALVGYPATTLEPIGLRSGLEPSGHIAIGHILVQGEIWQATSTTPIAARQPVQVIGHHANILEVKAQ